MKKTFLTIKHLALVLVIFLFTQCGLSDEKIKTREFRNRFEQITESTPQELCELFNEKIKNASDNSPFKNYSIEMIKSQQASFYKVASEQQAKLIIDVLFYKGIISKKNVSMEKIESYVNDIRKNKKDRLDDLVVESFDLMFEYEQEKIKLENNL